MYARRLGDRELTFDFAEGLIKNNLLFVDRESHSIWSQLDGKAIHGLLKETPLSVIPSLQTTWKHWREIHPDTRVWVIEGERGRPYLYRNWQPGTPRPKNLKKVHDTSTLGLGIVIGNTAMFFPFQVLDKIKGSLGFEVEGKELTIHYRKEALTAWAEDMEGRLLPAVIAYKEGWMRFHPNSEILRTKEFVH